MPYTIASDIHTHTLYSRHAYSTIGENVAAARDAGLELLGSADHFSRMIWDVPDVRNYQYFLNARSWPRVWDGVTLLRAAEVDIMSLDGTLYGQDMACEFNIDGNRYRSEGSLFDRVTAQLDYVVASVHNHAFAEGASIAETTRMYINVLENPKVLVLGHVGRSGVPFDIDEVLACAKDLGKLIEINNHSLEDSSRKHESCRRIAQRCAELGVGISVSSDAHIAPRIGCYPQAKAMLEEIGFPEELIINRGRDVLLDAMAAAGVCDLTDLKGGAAPEGYAFPLAGE